MYKHLNRILVLMVLLIGNAGFALAQKYCISGKLTGFKNSTGVELIDAESETKIGKTTMQNGAFTLTGTMKNGPRYLDLAITEAGKGYYCKVFAGAEKITITGDKKDFPYDLKISGPEEQLKYNLYQIRLKNYNIKLDNFMQAYKKAKPNSFEQRNAAIANNKVADEKRVVDKKLLLANTNTYYAADNLYEYLPEINGDELSRMYNNFSAPIKKSVYGKRIQNYLSTHGKGILIGDKIYDFEANDATGKPRKLSAYLGKYILLDFSSVHCGPCIESDDELRMLARKYKAQLHIITFSADKKSEWLKGIKDENVTWISVNDGSGLRGKTMLKYDAPGFPGFYIISPQGVVLDTWTGYEKVKSGTGQLEQRLVKYLKKN